jgi:hypothetical protein
MSITDELPRADQRDEESAAANAHRRAIVDRAPCNAQKFIIPI